MRTNDLLDVECRVHANQDPSQQTERPAAAFKTAKRTASISEEIAAMLGPEKKPRDEGRALGVNGLL